MVIFYHQIMNRFYTFNTKDAPKEIVLSAPTQKNSTALAPAMISKNPINKSSLSTLGGLKESIQGKLEMNDVWSLSRL